MLQEATLLTKRKKFRDEKTQDNILIEEFIKNNKPIESFNNCFSPKHIPPKRKAWEKISNSIEQNLAIFALEGYSNYGYYRAKDRHIYMIKLYLGELDSYLLIE
jgi:hypothetical protein